MSTTVATALKVFVKDNEADETAKFVEMFDKFFDALNVTNYTKCIVKRKYFQTVYRWAKDFRLEVLKYHFIVLIINDVYYA